jgi:hypothetical protein
MVCVSSFNEEGVGIVSRRQQDATGGDTVRTKTMGELLCCLLAALVLIDIEGEIYSAWTITELAELNVVEMDTQRASHVVKSCLS